MVACDRKNTKNLGSNTNFVAKFEISENFVAKLEISENFVAKLEISENFSEISRLNLNS